jgi:hypothetical protein
MMPPNKQNARSRVLAVISQFDVWGRKGPAAKRNV